MGVTVPFDRIKTGKCHPPYGWGNLFKFKIIVMIPAGQFLEPVQALLESDGGKPPYLTTRQGIHFHQVNQNAVLDRIPIGFLKVAMMITHRHLSRNGFRDEQPLQLW